MDNSIYFKTEDFIAFGVLLAVSAVIGIYFAFKDRHNSSVNNYYFGGRKMSPITIGMSMVVTFISAIGFISYPAECYIVGNALIWNYVVCLFVVFFTIIYFIPAFHRLPIRTTFEYLELRFNTTLRRLAAVMKILSEIFYVGLVVYVPSVSLNAVTPLSLNLSIVLTALVCTFYTTIGGIKAVIWTDAIQLLFMLIGVTAILIKGLIDIGGLDNLFAGMDRSERNTAFRFDYGIISRVSPLGIILGASAQYYNSLALSQQFVQRYWACKTAKQAQCSLVIYFIPSTLLGLSLIGVGLLMYAYYEHCDPVYSKKIASIDQAVPYMALELFENLPGMAGMFVASIYSASLSTVSSSLNSFSMVIVEDLLSPLWKRLANSERLKVFIGKILVIVLGVLLMVIAFAASLSKSNIMKLLYSFIGIFSGPLIGVFTLGFFFPCASSLGAMIGMLVSFMFGVVMFVGSEFLKTPYPSNLPPRSADHCVFNTTTVSQFQNETTTIADFATTATGIDSTATLSQFQNETTTIADFSITAAGIEYSPLQDFYNLNYNTFSFFTMLSCILVGIIASLLTGPNEASKADPKLFIPLVDNSCLPEKMRFFFRFGVPELNEWKKDQKENFNEDSSLEHML